MQKVKITPNQYQELAQRTESCAFADISERMGTPDSIRLLHAAMGMTTEVGEFMDPIKKFFYYNKPMDKNNLAEEIGDVLWYCAIAADALGTDLETIMKTNIAKLSKRFPENFDEDKAIVRDLQAEHDVLMEGHGLC